MNGHSVLKSFAATSALLIAASTAQAANSWPTFMLNNMHTGFNKSETTLNTGNVGTMVNKWSVSVGNSQGFSVNVYAFSEQKDLLFGPGADFSSVAALNVADGSVKWQTELVPLPPNNSLNLTPAVIARGVVYAGAKYAFQINGVSSQMFALSEKTGAVLWSNVSVCNQGDIHTPPTVAGGLVYFGDDLGNITALNASTGAEVWAASAFGGSANCNGGGPEVEGSPGYTTNTSLGNVLYVGAADSPRGTGAFTSFNAATGAVLWSTSMGPVLDTAAIGAGKVFVNADDGNLYALNDTTGAIVWKFAPAGGDFGYGAPVYANGIVYMIDGSSDLYALNARKGTVLWEDANGADSEKTPAIANGVLYAPRSAQLSAFDASNGSLLFAQGFSCNPLGGEPVVVNGAVYEVSVSSCGGQNALWKFGLP